MKDFGTLGNYLLNILFPSYEYGVNCKHRNSKFIVLNCLNNNHYQLKGFQ